MMRELGMGEGFFSRGVRVRRGGIRRTARIRDQ